MWRQKGRPAVVTALPNTVGGLCRVLCLLGQAAVDRITLGSPEYIQHARLSLRLLPAVWQSEGGGAPCQVAQESG